MCFLLLQNTTSEFHYKLTRSFAHSLTHSRVFSAHTGKRERERVRYTRTSEAYMYDVYRIGEAGPTVCTQESPFRQFHSSSHSLRTNLTMLHICSESSRCEKTYYENKRRKRKNENNEYTHALLHPFLALSIAEKIIMCTLCMGYIGYACYTHNSNNTEPTDGLCDRLRGYMQKLDWSEWDSERIDIEKHHVSSGKWKNSHGNQPTDRHV